MNLYLLRHGLAIEPEAAGFSKDSERPLTLKGERKLWKIAEAMSELDLKFDLIISSPYVRARQTAEIIAEANNSGKKSLEFCEHLTPAGDAKKLVEYINQKDPMPEDLLLVGHEPQLSGMISFLVFGNADATIQMKKAGLCKLSVEILESGQCATLEWLLTPRQMCLMV